jgi:galactonate dehydratase
VKIAAVEDLHCDAGWRTLSFLKITTECGVVGWSEFNEGYGSSGLTAVVRAMGALIIGVNPLESERIVALLYAMSRQLAGGVNAQAIGAIENALLDIKGKAYGAPVYMLFGGPVRRRLDLYWSHCGTRRLAFHEVLGKPAIRSLQHVEDQAREVVKAGFNGLKTNIIRFGGDSASVYMPGFGQTAYAPALNPPPGLMTEIVDEMTAFRRGGGAGLQIFLDLNFNFRPETLKGIAAALEPIKLAWLEVDLYDPAALARLRASIKTPIASGESLLGRRDYRPYFEAGSFDVAIVDAIWNGFGESLKIAAMADAYELNVAPHNFYGHLATAISAQFCATLPNFRIMEIDIDEVPWLDECFTWTPSIKDGVLTAPDAPGWGVDVNEDAVRAHPPRPEALSQLMKPIR